MSTLKQEEMEGAWNTLDYPTSFNAALFRYGQVIEQLVLAKADQDKQAMIEGQREVITDLENRLDVWQAALIDAWDRMDRARNNLTDGNPRPECNWGMLDTSLDRKALQSPAPVSETPSQTDSDSMCPNCVTPWKSNGPHIQPTLADPTHSEQQEPKKYDSLLTENCPFCGSDDVSIESNFNTYAAGCNHCGISIGEYSSPRSAARTWNMRPAPQLSQEQIQEAFKKLSGLSAEEADADREAGHLGKFDYFKEGVEFALQSQTKQSDGSEGL